MVYGLFPGKPRSDGMRLCLDGQDARALESWRSPLMRYDGRTEGRGSGNYGVGVGEQLRCLTDSMAESEKAINAHVRTMQFWFPESSRLGTRASLGLIAQAPLFGTRCFQTHPSVRPAVTPSSRNRYLNVGKGGSAGRWKALSRMLIYIRSRCLMPTLGHIVRRAAALAALLGAYSIYLRWLDGARAKARRQ